MTIQALYSAATGMTAMETKLDVVANNLANLETTAFKRDRANFEDLFYRHEKLPGAEDTAGQYTPTGIQIGLGVRTQSTQTEFTQGPMKQTGQELDVAIQGRGFFQVKNPDGHDSLHQGGKLVKKRQRQSGNGLGKRRAIAGTADRHSARRHGHRHQSRRHCYRPATGKQPN